jgi:hypothetical protein
VWPCESCFGSPRRCVCRVRVLMHVHACSCHVCMLDMHVLMQWRERVRHAGGGIRDPLATRAFLSLRTIGSFPFDLVMSFQCSTCERGAEHAVACAMRARRVLVASRVYHAWTCVQYGPRASSRNAMVTCVCTHAMVTCVHTRDCAMLACAKR